MFLTYQIPKVRDDSNVNYDSGTDWSTDCKSHLPGFNDETTRLVAF